MKYTSQRGTRDILPEEMPVWHALEKTCLKLFELYNYHEIRTPIFESTELFLRSIGQDTDIVSKEMYTFTDKGDRSITLRPEETAPVVRAAIQNNLINKDKLTKLYYIGPMFRYERPQAGRYRQFYQAGVEVFGSADPSLDAEVILLAEQIMQKLGLPNVEVDINSVGCRQCRPNYLEKLKSYFSTHKGEMCDNCQDRADRNVLRVLDCKDKKCQDFILKAPAIIDSLCPECLDHFNKVKKHLTDFGVNFKINTRLVRGLDYYTKTTFEVISKQLGAQNAVCGGGRYDNLVSEFGGDDIPAIGFAVGLDRLVEILKTQSLIPSTKRRKLIYIATIGDEARKYGLDLLAKLRKMGKISDIDYLGKSLKTQLKEADRQKAKYVLVIGEDEIKSGNVTLRDMEKAEQEPIPMAGIFERIEKL